MKQIAKSLVVVSALAIAGSAVAEFGFGEFNPFIGASYSQVMSGGKGPYSGTLPKNFPAATVYVGTKFHEYVGVKLGYTWTKSQSRSTTMVANFDGAVGAAQGAKSKLRTRTTFLDIVGFLPVMDCVELTGSLGLGYINPKLQLTNLTPGNATGTPIRGFGLKSTTVMRVGAGVNYMATDMIGVNLGIDWQANSRVKFKNNANRQALIAAGAKTQKPLKSSTIFNVGAFVKF